MVVEDDEEMNQLQREFLAIHGMDAISAYSGTQALDVNLQSRADAILLDIMLPEMDGFETCRRIRSSEQTRTPIVIVTALDTDDYRKRGFDAGADAFFSKPFDPDEVVSTIRRLIDECSNHRS